MKTRLSLSAVEENDSIPLLQSVLYNMSFVFFFFLHGPPPNFWAVVQQLARIRSSFKTNHPAIRRLTFLRQQ